MRDERGWVHETTDSKLISKPLLNRSCARHHQKYPIALRLTAALLVLRRQSETEKTPPLLLDCYLLTNEPAN